MNFGSFSLERTPVIMDVNISELRKECLDEEKKSKKEGREPKMKDWDSFYAAFEEKKNKSIEEA